MKIVGEGVLAVFQSTASAVHAAVTLMKKMDLNELPLRTAIDHGPAMVTTLNDRLDYFGATVTISVDSLCRIHVVRYSFDESRTNFWPGDGRMVRKNSVCVACERLTVGVLAAKGWSGD